MKKKSSAHSKRDARKEAIRGIEEAAVNAGEKTHAESVKGYAKARKYYSMLERKDRAKVFMDMKRIKQAHDHSLIKHTHAMIRETIDSSRKKGGLDENIAMAAYKDAHDAYQSLPEQEKEEAYLLVNSSYHGLLLAMINQRIFLIQDELKKKRLDNDKALGIYNEIKDLYDKLPEEGKEAAYPQVRMVYSMVVQTIPPIKG